MYGAQRNTLVVGFGRESFDNLVKVLRAAKLHAEHEPTATSALEAIGFLPFDAIVAAFPLPDMEMQDFLDAVRREGSNCRKAGVVLIAPQDLFEQAQQFLGRGANRVLTPEDLTDQLPHVLSRLCEVPPRVAVRGKLRLEVGLSPRAGRRTCHSENVSFTGMLIRSDRTYPIGTQLSFELTMPGDSTPIRGLAVVVRRTLEERETVSGFAVQFLSFHDDDKTRFQHLLTRLLGVSGASEPEVRVAQHE
jgi:CheY-like chemotaxis protein